MLQISLLFVCGISFTQNSNTAYKLYTNGLIYDNKGESFKAFKNLSEAKKIYESLNFKDSVAWCNLNLFNVLISQDSLNYDPKKYLNDCSNYALKNKDTVLYVSTCFKYAYYFFDVNNTETSFYYYKKILKLTSENKKRAAAYANMALLYTKTKPDSANLFFNKALSLYKKKEKYQLTSTYINYANFFALQNNFIKGIEQLKQAEKIIPTKHQLKFKQILFKKYSSYYKELNDYKKAFKYLKKYNFIKDSLNYAKQNIEISNLDKKYKTAEKDKQIIEAEVKRKQNENLFIVALFVLFLSGIIYYLNLKNSKRKRLLAEQQKELEVQRNITLLKEQEITTINAMVDGQEKERIRIAEDLHDNIGSVLATLKIHFENLKLNREKKHFNQDELYQKTEKLIDETYFKVRSIAHAKNAGVIANKGLLTAVKIMAEKISDANKIEIEVLDFGLEKPLENSLEITLFRIIQELTTNVIKHAEASNATINLSLYDNNLNIIIEDNGKGFSFKELNLNNGGMGLASIKTRVKHLNGTFDVDATLNKGTSILINIPV